MIPNDNAIILYKFSEKQWIQKLLDGELSFSCAGAFIFQAKKTGNKVQGDEYEAVFARLDKNNPKIEEMRKILGNDLEEISDGDFIFLRRKSAKTKPIYCIFGYTAGDAIQDGAPQKVGPQKVKFEFDERLYEGFASENVKNVIADSHRFTFAAIRPNIFVSKVKNALKLAGLAYEMRAVEYIDMHTGEFFIDPTDRYPELFIKSSEYKYQHEMRICLVDHKLSVFFDRFPLYIGKFNEGDFGLCYGAVLNVFDVVFSKRKQPS